ncbi:MAG: glycosyltransferase [Lachnospiraceae bacterium]|nr:glycosyltransferase [Lachnospiraceae bacterium]
MEQEKISIICIIYQVAPYLRQCLDSILAQTYRNLEIILVVGQGKKDDASLDIAEEYAERDPRIRIVATPAKGTGDARNQGLRAASGSLIGFIDGDDYAEPDMMERLSANLKQFDADISVCGRFSEFDDRTVADGPEGIRQMVPEDAFEMILRGTGFFFHCWDKLFRAELIKNEHFPTDRYLEDRYVIGRVLGNAKNIVYDKSPLYHYRVRGNSLSRVDRMSEYNVDADTEFCEYATGLCPRLGDLARSYLVYDHITCIQNYHLRIKGTAEDTEEMRERQKKHEAYLREELKRKNPELSFKVRFKAFLALYMRGVLLLITKKHSL